MAQTVEDILQNALTYLGVSYVASGDTPLQADMRRRIPSIRDTLLYSYKWDFAVALRQFQQSTLSFSANLPQEQRFLYAYDFTDDTLRMLGLNATQDPTYSRGIADDAGVVTGRKYYTNEQHGTDNGRGFVWAWVVSQVTDSALWNPLFAEAMVAELVLSTGWRASPNPLFLDFMLRQRARLEANILFADQESSDTRTLLARSGLHAASFLRAPSGNREG